MSIEIVEPAAQFHRGIPCRIGGNKNEFNLIGNTGGQFLQSRANICHVRGTLIGTGHADVQQHTWSQYPVFRCGDSFDCNQVRYSRRFHLERELHRQLFHCRFSRRPGNRPWKLLPELCRGGSRHQFLHRVLMVSQATFSPDSAMRVLTSGPAKWRRGVVLENISDRAIEFGALTTYAMYGQGNQTIFNNGGAWAWQNSSSSLALHRFTPAADDTNTELFGSNAANNAVTWNVDNSGNFLAGSFRTRTALPSLTGIFRCASSDACLSFRNNANNNDIPLAKNVSDQLTFGGTVLTGTIASGTATMTTALIAAGACGTTVTVSAANVLTTDSISWSYNAAVGANPGVLIVNEWPTANNVNFAYCNGTAAGVTPTAATLNFRVVR